MLWELSDTVSEHAAMLAETFMPGPITIIVKKNSKIGNAVTAGLDTVAVRCPDHTIARGLIRSAGVPVAAPSANLSGKPSPTEGRHVIADMQGKIDCIIDGGPCRAGVESTVVDATGKVPVILRPGVVTYEDIKKVIPSIQMDEHILKSVAADQTPKCPGMKYKHYAPDAQVFVVEGAADAVKKKVNHLISLNRGKKTGVLRYFSCNAYDNCDVVLEAGSTNREYAKNLFSCLRRFDELGVEIVFAEFREEDGCGLAVKNRLYKSAANRIYYV